ncbi:MAG: hypothetical protein NUV60_01025 [Patescibacteria group bacterium]|nr:hypothetical protein [Patescibacteria group bacterium]
MSPADCIGYWWINVNNARLVTPTGGRQPILPAFLTLKIHSGQLNADGSLQCFGEVAVSGNSSVNLFVNPNDNTTYVNLSMPASVIDGENQTHTIWINMKLFGSPRDNNLPGILEGSFRHNLAPTPSEMTLFIFHADGDFQLMQRGVPDAGKG